MDARPMARYFPRLIARCYSQAVPALCTVPRRHGDEAQHLAAACVLHVKHVAWQRLPLRDAAQIEREVGEARLAPRLRIPVVEVEAQAATLGPAVLAHKPVQPPRHPHAELEPHLTHGRHTHGLASATAKTPR